LSSFKALSFALGGLHRLSRQKKICKPQGMSGPPVAPLEDVKRKKKKVKKTAAKGEESRNGSSRGDGGKMWT